MKRTFVALALAITILVPIAAGSIGRAAPATTVVMSGLDNPRGLAFGPEGALYVAEAGRSGPGGSGFTGAVSRLFRGVQERVATGLPSRLFPPANIIGPNDISFQGRGNAYVTIGMGGDPATRPALGSAGHQLGFLARVQPNGNWSLQEDISAYEAAANPDGFIIDSNPYGILALPGERLVTDAGANALFRVKNNGEISTVATFPARPSRGTDCVPTCVAKGPDGAFYVGELTGVPFAPGAARIYRVVPGEAPEVSLTGFTTVMDLEFGRDGSLYVLQHSSTGPFFAGPGALIRVAPDGTRTIVASEGLSRPTALAIGYDGAFYISNNGTSIGIGEVLRIEP